MALKHWGNTLNFQRFRGPVISTRTPVTLSTAGALTYTVDQLLSGLIVRDPNGAGRTDILPTAALIVASIPSPEIDAGFDFVVRNNADAAETITINAGAGGTLSAAGQSTTTSTVVQNNSRLYRLSLTNVTPGSEAYICYSLLSGTH